MTATHVKSCFWAALCLVFLPEVSVRAHVGDRVYPIAYLSDEMLEMIDLQDGSVDEWYDLVGDPIMTLLDFTEAWGEKALDPSDFDFRIWLAWHDDPARFYIAFVASDDSYKNTHDHTLDEGIRVNDSISVAIDGDHSGGAGCGLSNCSEEDWLDAHGQTQYYDAIARTPNGPTLEDPTPKFFFQTETEEFAWTTLPPYAEGGGGVAGEMPFISVIELYVTPFDRRTGNWDSPEEIVVSDLADDQVIGFAFAVFDTDESEHGVIWTPETMQPTTPDFDSLAVIDIAFLRADRFLDGLLLPGETGGLGDSAVGSVSWGRIKAALEVD